MACSKQAFQESAGTGKKTDYRQLLAPSKKWALHFIINTLFPYLPHSLSVHHINTYPGLSCVGSTTQQLDLMPNIRSSFKHGSDIDVMSTFPHLIVDQYPRHTCAGSHTLRGYSDTTHTRPGYLRILVRKRNYTLLPNQIRRNGSRCYVLSSILTTYILGTYLKDGMRRPNGPDSYHILGIHGPAIKYQQLMDGDHQSIKDRDIVMSIKCSEWPALEWANRTRPSRWPSEALVAKIVSEGCHIVSKAHPTSSESEAEIEFRYSFSIAEVKICKELCAVQKHCFLLYRYALETAAEGLSSECKLSSYHLKTICWWLCEKKSPGNWTNDTLGERLIDLLKHLLMCLRDANIPNYFIPENNMISHMSETNIQSLVELVDNVISDPVSYLVCCPHFLMHRYPPQVLFQPVLDILDCTDSVKRLETCVLTLQKAARFRSMQPASEWGMIKAYMGKQKILLRRLGHQISQSLLMSVLFVDSMKYLALMRYVQSESLFRVRLLAYTSTFLVAQKKFSAVLPLLHQADKFYQSLSQDEINEEFSNIRTHLSDLLLISYIQLGQQEKAKQAVSSYYGFPRTGTYSRARAMSEVEKELEVQNFSSPGPFYF